MSGNGWRQWVSEAARLRFGKSKRPTTRETRQALRFRPSVEALEDRVVPALNLTIVGGSTLTSGINTSSSGGTTTFSAIAANSVLNVLDMAAALAVGNVVVQTGLTGANAGSLFVAAGVTVKGTGGSVTLMAGGNLTLGAVSTIQSTNGTVTLDIGVAGGPGASVIQGTVQGSTTPSLVGGGGACNVILSFNSGANLPTGLIYTASPGVAGNSLTVSDQGRAVVATYSTSGGSVTRNGQTITTSSVTQVSIVGSTKNDTFTVLGSVGMPAIGINGGGGVDTLNYSQAAPIGTVPGMLAPYANRLLTYTAVAVINLQNTTGVNAMYGPNTAARATAFNGLTATPRFVQALYLDALGRAASTSELLNWVAVYNQVINSGQSQSIAQFVVATNIEKSQEARNRLVNSWFLTYLGRAASSAEQTSFGNLLLQGQSDEQVLSQLLGSPEFFNRAQTLISSGTPQQRYVQALFSLLLFRTGSAANVQTWVNALNASSAAAVAAAFLVSPEFRTDQFTGYYNALLHAPADPSPNGLSFWVNAIGLNILNVRLKFESTPFFFTNG